MTSRQNNVEIPEVEDMFRRFQSWGMFGNDDLVCVFPSLLEPTPEEKLTNANLMADVLVKIEGSGVDTAPIAESIYEMINVKMDKLSDTERRIKDEGEVIDKEIDEMDD